MSESSSSFWSRAIRSLAARLPPWPILALVAGHLVLHIGVNVFWQSQPQFNSLKGVLLACLWLCQTSLLVVWLALGNAPRSLRTAALLLVVAAIWTTPGTFGTLNFPGSIGHLFWPHDPSNSVGLHDLETVKLVQPLHSLAFGLQLVLLGTPLLVLRLAGLRLGLVSASPAAVSRRWQFTIGQLILWTATVAIGLVAVQLVNLRQLWFIANARWHADTIVESGCLALPAVALALLSTLGRRLRLLWLSVCFILALAASTLQLRWPTTDSSNWRTADLVVALLIFSVLPFVSLLVVRYAGYRLTWRRSTRSADVMRQAAPASGTNYQTTP